MREEPCTDCGDTGVTYQTERLCACQTPASGCQKKTALVLPQDYELADRMIVAFEQYTAGNRVERVRLAASILAATRPGPYQPKWENPDGPGAA
jgi:hypothetical protein